MVNGKVGKKSYLMIQRFFKWTINKGQRKLVELDKRIFFLKIMT